MPLGTNSFSLVLKAIISLDNASRRESKRASKMPFQTREIHIKCVMSVKRMFEKYGKCLEYNYKIEDAFESSPTYGGGVSKKSMFDVGKAS